MKNWKMHFSRSTESVEEIHRRGDGICSRSEGRSGDGLYWQVVQPLEKAEPEVPRRVPGTDPLLRNYRGRLPAGSWYPERRNIVLRMERLATFAKAMGLILPHLLWWTISLSCAMRLGGKANSCIALFS